MDYLFGYPGGAVLPLYDTFYDGKIKHILARHEQGAVHAAEGYARVSGKTGVVVVTSGPGASLCNDRYYGCTLRLFTSSCIHWTSCYTRHW
ncbi:thiamine pyrophosphate-binding protein [Staphylococcus aureus]